ncbi:MAG TPA: cupredoxin domain-containing protein [Candidatus Binatia bacterium]|nr:cupredoxin domain-containing protein [Candidatus Binatia bacterium]
MRWMLFVLLVVLVACSAPPASQSTAANIPAPAAPAQTTPTPPLTPTATPSTPSQSTTVTIEADDKGFYPTNTITVPKGQKAVVTFKVRDTRVYYGGLQIKGPLFNTGDIKPGASATVEFTPTSDSTFASYWPSSGVKKADGKIVVT